MIKNIFFIFLFASVFFLSPAKSENYRKDNLIIPRERVGFITKNTTEEDLKRMLPANQIRRVVYDIEGGTVYCVTEVFPNSEKTVLIIWDDAQALNYDEDDKISQKKCNAMPAFSKIQFVEINQSFWQTENGVKIGMDLEQLEKVNGAPVTFSICKCDFGGNLLSWNDGVINLHVKFEYPMDFYEALKPYATKPDYGVLSSDLPSNLKTQITINNIAVFLQ